MSHTIQEKAKLLQRVRRMKGQLEAVERALDQKAECSEIMQLVVSIRGAANSLMAELVEDHIRMHVSDPARDRHRRRAKGAEHLIDLVHTYLK